MMLAGYGIGGSGALGYDAAEYPFGSLRVGENQYDPYAGTDDLTFDFDDGAIGHDALGSDGLGSREAFIAPGDAGGPSFINGQIAGVHSWVDRGDGKTDINKVLDSSFGEIAGDASVAYNFAFIHAAMLTTPEPRLMILVGIALVVISLVGGKRRCP